MKRKTILIIDDSATIRRLVNNELSSDGYHVVQAPTAEEGIEKAKSESPDLIILDHQLPGTTGFEVCTKLLSNPELAKIPVVVSSTLRKKAYVEYVDSPNVVDMLPKPYTGELLITTVENAIETAIMVVDSQQGGTAVPEVIGQVSESDLSGSFDCFSLREVLDLLNNSATQGVLEIEAESNRFWIYVQDSRIQAVVASGIEPEQMSQYIPESLKELAPVIKFTMRGKKCSEVDGLVQLLDKKVLDPRLLSKLLRIQASALTRFCLTGKLKSFRFEKSADIPPLFKKLPLNISLLALSVEGAARCDEVDLPAPSGDVGYVRKTVRGQNLDRSGLESRHLKLMNLLTAVRRPVELSQQTGLSLTEVRRILHGFELAGLVESKTVQKTTQIACISRDANVVQSVKTSFEQNESLTGKVVSDWLALDIMARRNSIDWLVVDLDGNEALSNLQKILSIRTKELGNVRLIGVSQSPDSQDQSIFSAVISKSELQSKLAQWTNENSSNSSMSLNQNASVIDSTSQQFQATSPALS